MERRGYCADLFAIVEALEGTLYIADMASYRVLFVNRTAREIFGGNLIGQVCYEVFSSRGTGPCPFCANGRLLDEKGKIAPPVVQEIQDPTADRWYKRVDRAIRWRGGRWVRMGITFDVTEAKRLAAELGRTREELQMREAKWSLEQEAGRCRVQVELEARRLAEKGLKSREKELRKRTRRLGEVTTALNVVLERMEEEKRHLERQLMANVNRLVIPHIEKIRKEGSASSRAAHLEIIEKNLKNIFLPSLSRLSLQSLALTSREIQVANLVREGMTSKEISHTLGISKSVVDFHRDHIRGKLGLKNKRGNLRSYMLSLD